MCVVLYAAREAREPATRLWRAVAVGRDASYGGDAHRGLRLRAMSRAISYITWISCYREIQRTAVRYSFTTTNIDSCPVCRVQLSVSSVHLYTAAASLSISASCIYRYSLTILLLIYPVIEKVRSNGVVTRALDADAVAR